MAQTPSPDPPDIGARVRAAERRRAIGVKLCVLTGACLVAAGLATYAIASHRGAAPLATLILLALGLLVAFPLAALLALLLGPTWEQRQQHWQSLHQRHPRDPGPHE